jgi:hypothetical protein
MATSSKIERTILLAEDEQCVRELLCRLVADVHMPKMGGVELARQLLWNPGDVNRYSDVM